MVQHPDPVPGVVRISRRAILLEICKQVDVQPPEFICRDSTDDGTFIAEATVWYCPGGGDDGGGPPPPPPLNRKITGRARSTREEAAEQVSEDAISFLKEEMSLARDDFNYPGAQMLEFQQERMEAGFRRFVDKINEAVKMLGKVEAGCFETIRAIKELKELVTSGAVLYKDCDVTKGLLPEFAGSDFNMEGARKVLQRVAERLEICYESACKRLGLFVDPVTGEMKRG